MDEETEAQEGRGHEVGQSLARYTEGQEGTHRPEWEIISHLCL
jgi:hypothetical protein